MSPQAEPEPGPGGRSGCRSTGGQETTANLTPSTWRANASGWEGWGSTFRRQPDNLRPNIFLTSWVTRYGHGADFWHLGFTDGMCRLAGNWDLEEASTLSEAEGSSSAFSGIDSFPMAPQLCSLGHYKLFDSKYRPLV